MVYYAIVRGIIPGIYDNWNSARKQIEGYFPAKYKTFDTKKEAEIYMNSQLISNDSTKINDMLDMFSIIKEEPIKEKIDDKLICFTDGSAINNGKINVKAGFSVVWPNNMNYNYSEKLIGENATNNRAEYSAVISALNIADVIDPSLTKSLYVYSDSMLLINSLTKWLPGWKRNNYKKADGYPVKNLDLLKIFEEKMLKRKLIMIHVKAHTGNSNWESKYNDLADKLAKKSTE
jgi:ribonuclease HI